jgi:energy-coupling factor transport system permease protein
LISIFTLVLLFVLLLISHSIWRIRGFRLAFFTGVSLFILYLIFDKSGEMLISCGVNIFDVTQGGLDMGLRVSGRFLAIIFISYIFILTTDPNLLAYSLMKLGLPYRFGFMIVTALRLAPILEDEGRAIYNAQLVRGVHYDKQGLRKLILLMQQFLSPLLFSAIRRADKLVFSMEGRGFGRYATRTFHDQTKPSNLDLFFTAGLIIVITACLYVEIGEIL